MVKHLFQNMFIGAASHGLGPRD